jgi:hypothetical protein
MQVCRSLYETIASSARLQLVLELYAYQVFVGPSVSPTPSGQLAALRQFWDEWVAMRPMRKKVIDHERMECIVSNGYILGTIAPPGEPLDLIHVWELPSYVLGRHHMERQTTTYPTHEGQTRAIEIDPFQDLLMRLVTGFNGSVRHPIC